MRGRVASSTMVMDVLGNAVNMEMTGAFDGPQGSVGVGRHGLTGGGTGRDALADQLAGLGGPWTWSWTAT